MKTFSIKIYFGEYFEQYIRECEDYGDARCEAEEIISTQYTKNGNSITRYTIEEITD